jgi:hypothetical protein
VRRRWTVLAWVVSLAAGLAPLFATRDLPIIDLPNHLAQAALWLHWDDPTWAVPDCYQLEVRPLPYTFYLGWLRWLGELMPLQAANKLWMAASLLGLVAATACLLGAFGRPRILALAAIPLYWSGSVLWGLLNFSACLPLLILAVALAARGRVGLAAIAGGLLYWLHPLGLAAWIGLGPLIAPGRWRRIAVVLPALACFLAGVLLAPGGKLAPRFAARWVPPWRTLAELPFDALGCVGPLTAIITLVILVGGVVALRRLTPGDPAAPRDHRPWWLLGVCLFYAVALPHDLEKPIGIAGVAPRFVPLPLLMALLLVPAALTPRLRKLVLAALVAINLWHGGEIFLRFTRATADDRAFLAMVAKLPPRAEALVLLKKLRHESYPRIYIMRIHQQARVQLEIGGFDAQGWQAPFPVTSRPQCRKRFPRLPSSRVSVFKWDKHVVDYRWFLVRGATDALDHRPVTRIAEDGDWSLWRRTD